MTRRNRLGAPGSAADSGDATRRAHRVDEEDRDGTARSEAIFLRGLSLGALIGAAIAGSAIWERRRMRRLPRAGRPAATSRPPSGPDAGGEPGSGD